MAELLAENALILERMRVRTDPRQIKLKYFFGKTRNIFVIFQAIVKNNLFPIVSGPGRFSSSSSRRLLGRPSSFGTAGASRMTRSSRGGSACSPSRRWTGSSTTGCAAPQRPWVHIVSRRGILGSSLMAERAELEHSKRY